MDRLGGGSRGKIKKNKKIQDALLSTRGSIALTSCSSLHTTETMEETTDYLGQSLAKRQCSHPNCGAFASTWVHHSKDERTLYCVPHYRRALKLLSKEEVERHADLVVEYGAVRAGIASEAALARLGGMALDELFYSLCTDPDLRVLFELIDDVKNNVRRGKFLIHAGGADIMANLCQKRGHKSVKSFKELTNILKHKYNIVLDDSCRKPPAYRNIVDDYNERELILWSDKHTRADPKFGTSEKVLKSNKASKKKRAQKKKDGAAKKESAKNNDKKRKAKATSTASTNAANGANGKENKANPKPTSNKKHATEKKMKAKTASPEMKSAPGDSMKPSAYSSDEDEAASPKKKSALEDSMKPSAKTDWEQWEMNSDEDSVNLSDYSSDEDEAALSWSDKDDEWKP